MLFSASYASVWKGFRGGGVALYYKSFPVTLIVPRDWTSFERMEVKLGYNSQTLRLAVIYQAGHRASDISFLREFGTFLEHFSLKQGKLLICGYFK